MSRQWIEFQKVRACRILTTKISMCVDRRYLYFFPDRKSTNVEKIRMHWDARVSKRCHGSSWMGVNKEQLARKLFYLLSTDFFTTKCDFRGISILLSCCWQKYWFESKKKNKLRTLAKTSSCGSFYLRNWMLSFETLVYIWIEPHLSN